MGYRYEILSPEKALAFDSMTFPAHRRALAGASVAAGAWFNGEPAGLALCAQGRKPSEAELLSLFVAQPHRLGGVGTSLLALAETFLLAGGMDGVHTVWTRSMAGAPAFGRVLEKRGWSDPGKRLLLLRERLDGPFAKGFRKKAAGMRSPHSLPRGYAATPWADLTPEEIDFIRTRQGLPGWYAPRANPLREAHLIDPTLSPVLRRDGAIVGWITVHRASRDTARMTDVFVRTDEPRMRGVGASLVVLTIESLIRARVPVLHWGIEYDNAPLRNLCQRWLGDIADLTWTLGAEKRLWG